MRLVGLSDWFQSLRGVALALGLGACSAAAPPIEVANTDVTLVYPLPKAAELDLMLAATSSGAFGELVPAEAFAKLPGPLDPRPGAATTERGEAGRAKLRLVGARLDPCFADLGDTPAARCQNQLRLIFQGLRAEGDVVRADDGAVHVFVALTRDELLGLVRDLLAAKQRAGGYSEGPLGQHPLLKAQGLGSAFAAELRTALLLRSGAGRVTRVTFFLRSTARQGQWFFGVFDRERPVSGALVGLREGAFAAQKIPTTDFEQQVLDAGLAVAGELAGNVPTPTNHADNLLLLLDTAATRAASTTAQARAFDAALRIENPRRHSPDTIDCVSCHVATPARRATEAALGLSAQGNPNAYSATRSLAYAPPPRPSLENLHSLSYLDRELGLNQRTANETAAVATALAALLAAP